MTLAVPHRSMMTIWRRTPWLALAFLAAACAGIEPMAMPDQRENPEGPGVFSGEDGEFVIYRH